MQRKLNEGFINEYGKQFSEKITSGFFEENDFVTGKEILNLTPSKQVNFFILKILFAKWQEEMKALESPYFNYRNTEVRRALVEFMNVLSQHIEVEFESLYDLVCDAVCETLRLLADPYLFLVSELGDKDLVITEKVTKPFLKYIKLYRNHIKQVIDQSEGKSIDGLLTLAKGHFEDLDIQSVALEELGLLSEVVPLELLDLYKEEPGKDDMEEGFEMEEEGFDESIDNEEESNSGVPTGNELGIDDALSEEEEPDESDSGLNRQYQEVGETINDLYRTEREGEMVVDQLQKYERKSIMEAISINHQYMFTKELFNGSREAFREAISQVEQCESFDQAVELLVQRFAKDRDWNMNSEEVKELLKIIFRKFR